MSDKSTRSRVTSDAAETPAHNQHEVHQYTVRYPAHEPRADDPHYKDFEAYRRRTKATARCAFAVRVGDDSECDHDHPLELHHSHIEFAMANEVDLTRLEHLYPGVSDRNQVGAWIETADNLTWYCRGHHRGPGGVHSATAADFEAEHFIRNLITP